MILTINIMISVTSSTLIRAGYHHLIFKSIKSRRGLVFINKKSKKLNIQKMIKYTHTN